LPDKKNPQNQLRFAMMNDSLSPKVRVMRSHGR